MASDAADLRLRAELAAHLACLPLEPQHLDFGDDFLGVELARELELAVEQLASAFSVSRRFLSARRTSMSCAILRTRVSNTLALGLDRARRAAQQLVGENAAVAPVHFGLEPRDARRHGGAAFADLAELRGELGVVDAHQRLALRHDRAFLHQDGADDAAFQRLHDLHLARRNDPAVAALDLVEHGEMRPDQADNEQRKRRRQQHARGARRSQLDRGADVVGEGEIRRLHYALIGFRRRRRRSAAACWRRRAAWPAPCRADRRRPAGPVEQQQAVDQRQQRRADASRSMIVILRSASVFSRSRNSASLRTSKCAVGSSRNRIFGLPDQDAGEADRLLLPAGQAAPALGDRHVVAQRMAGDEALDAGEARGRQHLLVGGVRLAERDVVAQLAEEQIGVLQHEADAGAQIGRVVLAHIDAVDEDAAVLRIVEARPAGGRPWSCRSRRAR